MTLGNLIAGIQFFAALLMLFLAWLIKYRKRFELIAGYNEQQVINKNGLANWVGSTLLIAGIIALLLSVAMVILPAKGDLFLVGYIFVIAAGAVIAAIGGSRYKTKQH